MFDPPDIASGDQTAIVINAVVSTITVVAVLAILVLSIIGSTYRLYKVHKLKENRRRRRRNRNARNLKDHQQQQSENESTTTQKEEVALNLNETELQGAPPPDYSTAHQYEDYGGSTVKGVASYSPSNGHSTQQMYTPPPPYKSKETIV